MTAIKRRSFQKSADQVQAETRAPRAAIYTRVSTEEQAGLGFSLEGQLEKLRDYCKIRDYKVASEYVEQGGSGRKITEAERPQYVRMMKDVDRWDLVLVLKMDRIHRNSRNFTDMIDTLRRKGKDFVSITDNLDTSTAMGRFAADMIQRIAQLEVEQIAERTFFGLKAKISGNGEARSALGQSSPYGYRWKCPSEHELVKRDENGSISGREICPGAQLHRNAVKGSALVVFDDEAQHVREIFKRARDGGSARGISVALSWCSCKPKVEQRRYKVKDRWTCKDPHEIGDGQTCPGGVDHYADPKVPSTFTAGGVRIWKGTTLRGDCPGCLRVKYILTNPAYLGNMIVWGDQIYASDHPALVDRKTFEAYNRRRAVPVILPKPEELR